MLLYLRFLLLVLYRIFDMPLVPHLAELLLQVGDTSVNLVADCALGADGVGVGSRILDLLLLKVAYW